MVNGTRSSRKANDGEDNNSKGGQTSGKKSVNSGAATAEVSGFRRSLRETLSKKSMTPSSSSGTRKSERLEKQTSNSNTMTPPSKRKSERIEKQKHRCPLRRSERGKMPSSSGSSGLKKSDKSLDSLDAKRKKEKKEKSVKQLTMETVEVNKIENEDGQVDEAQKKRMDARAYRAMFRKQLKSANATDHGDDLNRTDSERRDEDLLKVHAERTCEITMARGTSQSAEEAPENKNDLTLFPTSQKDSCKDMSSNGDGSKVSKSGSVAGKMNDDAEKAVQDPELVNSMLHERILDCNISLEMVQEVMSSERKRHDMDTDSVASPITSSKNICTSMAGAETLLISGCKRKDCSETCGTCSKRQRVDCDLTKQEVCSSNTKLNQLFQSSDIKDRWKLDAGVSTGHVEKCCNDIQKHMSVTDLRTDPDQNTCIVCNLVGKLLCCEGKGCHRSYHLSCLEHPLEEVPVGVWHCPVCVSKKLESGVHSVSEGIEAILDSREVEASEDGLQRQKQYFVKYKGLAHVHNRWVPENLALLEAPSLVAKYNRRTQGAVWKQQWAVPHRVLQKRFLVTPEECHGSYLKGHDGEKLNCHVEWLVKWRGLGYEHASWELENASFFSCPEGQSLIRDYEIRRKKAKTASKFDKERREVACLKLSQLPAGVSPGLDANLDALNKLCNYWRKGQNAIIFDDQERILNVISFILSSSSDISQPFLIISTSSSQYSWDEEFLHLAPSVDVVVYSGSKEIRKSIRTLEFYEEGGCIMFQVLITSPEVISEDLDVLASIGWEAIIVDECQRPRIASCFEQIKMLTASKRLLIVSSQLKDNVAEYLNLLSLLDSQSNLNGSDSLLMNSSDNIGTLKERLAKYIAYECKLESSRFVEYWVPVLLSNVQLEQYCFTLLSNSFSLCSPSKTDPVGALRNILISSRKCCDHPYVVDQSLQMLLTKSLKEIEFLDVGIKASGKLQLLDAMLSEIKKRELKVLILFQSIGGSGRDLLGDILDDFLRQRFGADSYERIDGGVFLSKKQSALNKFNNERERFVFLLETRACLPSIKLSAVGTVIIFGSDWSPMNDLRALQRITLDSQFEQIKIFRLYSSFTVEEKVLMLSKQDKTLDSNTHNVSPSSCHMLLKWGASHLFNQLGKFHGIPTSDAGTLSEQSHLIDVIKECFIILDQTGIDNDASKLSLILLAKQKQGTYRTEMPLFGEQKIQVMNEDPPHIFWTKLLEGKNPQWKYSSCSSQRNRKRVQNFDGLLKKPEAESSEVVKRRKKVVSDCNDHLSPKAGLREGKMAAGDREGILGIFANGLSHSLSRSTASESDEIHAISNSLHLANNISKIPAVNMVEREDRRKQRDSQKNLHVLLMPQIAQLCEVLHLSEVVKAMVERFLEYVMNNHRVSREPETILQAFQISLCWSAASLLKHKIDHKESLALAKQHLGFTCKKDEADYVYSLLRCLKRMFLYRTGYLKVPNSPKGSEQSSKALGRDYSNATSCHQNVKAKIEDMLGFQEGSDVQVRAESGVAPEFHLAQRDLLKSIKEIQKKCDKHMTKLREKQREEMKQFNLKCEEEKAQLENKKRTEAAVIRLLSNVTMRTDKLKKLDIEYAGKFDELKLQMDVHLKNLEAEQLSARSNALESKTRWVEAVKAWAQAEFVRPPVSEVNLSEGRSSAGIIHSVSGNEVRVSKSIHIVPDDIMACSDPICRVTCLARPFKENSEGASVEECNVTVCSGGDEEQAVYKASCPREGVSGGEIPDGGVALDVPVTVTSGYVTDCFPSMRCSDEDKISDGSKLNMSNGDPETVPPTDGPENLICVEAPSCEEIPDGATLSKPIPFTAADSVSFCKNQEKLASLQAPSSEKISNRDSLRKIDEDVPLRESVTVISCEGQENLISLEAPSSVEVPDGTNLRKVDGQVPLGEPLIAISGEGQENLSSAEAPSSEEIPDGATLSMADVVLPSSAAEAVGSSEGQENITTANSSSEKHIPGGATFIVSDGEVPKSTSEIETSSHGMVCQNPSSKEQITDAAEEGSLVESETAPSEVLEGGSVHRQNVQTSAIGIDQQDVEVCTVNQEPEFEEPSLADLPPVQHVPIVDQGGPLAPDQVSPNAGSLPSAIQARDVVNSETQTASQVAETSSPNATIDVRCNEPNPDTTVLELSKRTQVMRSGESTSYLSPPNLPSVSAIEHQSNNEGQTANQISQALRQSVANHIELSNQDVLQPLHSPIDGTIGGLVRQASETRTASLPPVSSGLPVQTAPAVSSRMPLPLYNDPLQNEMERIRKETDQTIKIHEDMKLQLKSECEKQIEEAIAQIRRNYKAKLKEKEAEFLLQKKELDVNYNKVLLNKILAEAFRSKCMDIRASGSAGAHQEASSSFMQQLVQLSSQQTVQQPSIASGLPPNGSAGTQTISPAVVNAQTTGPPLQAVNPSAFFSGTPTRPPHISSISPSAGNLQMSSEIRAPAPHLQPFRPSTSISPGSLPSQSRGMSNQQAHGNHPVAPPVRGQSYGNPPAHRPISTTCQSGRIPPETTGGLAPPPNASLPSLDVLMGINNLSGANTNPLNNLVPGVSSSLATLVYQESSLPRIQSNPAQQSGATDIVCLSDDD
ncbi:helicase protein MOM1-like isoform X1 [Herrania umbratica]|uniref:Helicase protein MOM1-like isoform X1 n=2 Tax=Herrania umbratica TaxID=108875 RepID=A0A6J0ZWY0_9ROSI|nr:helicase protein MOM1-like isoform X1 [Herrania umbratica]